jgi:filamentous hemagglutinin family protein
MVRRTLTACLLLTGLASALPEGGQVNHGQINIQGAGNILQILQQSPQGIINWSSFNISPQEIVRFLQPNGGLTLNRVTGQQASLIEGLLQANGTIYLLNPNGILFTPTAQVNAGSFVASTLGMSDSDFLQGKYQLAQQPGQPLASLVNQGKLEVADGGYLVLVAPLVHNEGLIVARQGQISVGASTQATLSFDPEGLLSFSIPDGWRGTHGQEHGSVLLTPGQLTDSLSGVLGIPASQEATMVPRGAGILVNTGTMSSQGPQGGNIYLDSAQATLNVRGGSLLANAESQGGQGGRIDVLSAGSATTTGVIEARGGEFGRGGFVELSGQRPNLIAPPDVSAAQGEAGTILIDPDTILLDDVPSGNLDTLLPDVLFGDGPNFGTVSIAALEAVGAGTILLEANNLISWFNNPADGHLDLQPGVGLIMRSGGSILANPGTLIRSSGADITISAIGNIQSPGLEMNGGVARIDSGAGRITLGGGITAAQVILNAAGMVFTGEEVINAGTGGAQITAAQLLGSSVLNDEAQINSQGLLSLTITGPNDPTAGVAAKVSGTLSSGVSLTQPPGAGSVEVNGLPISPSSMPSSSPSPGHSMESKPSPSPFPSPSPGESPVHGEPFVEPSDALPEAVFRSESLQETRQSLVQLGNLETASYDFTNGDLGHFDVKNRSLSNSAPIPLYSLKLVAIQVLDDPPEGFWDRFIEQFVIWEDSGEE